VVVWAAQIATGAASSNNSAIRFIGMLETPK
jgi:hypothetical protein